MSFDFRDSFDLYASISDPLAGWWDGSVNSSSMTLPSGRFSGGQALSFASSNTGGWFKNGGSNDAVHHITCAFQQTVGISGTNLGCYLTIGDGSTAQCSIVFRSDGTILLTSGASSGSVLATYSGAVASSSVWYAFEFEVVINNGAGSFTARTNGATGNSFQATGLITRGGTSNSYGNRLTIGMNTAVNLQKLDDLIWRSDTSSVSWLGDQRCYTQMPTSTASQQFALSPNPSPVTSSAISSTQSSAANAVRYTRFVATYTGTIGSVLISANAGTTANVKAAIYDSSGGLGGPGSLVGLASNTLVNPVTGNNTITFGTPPSVVQSTAYFLAIDQDATVVWNIFSTGVAGTSGTNGTTVYASFPASSVSVTYPSSVTNVNYCIVNITPTTNYQMTNEAQEDGTTTYVYDSTVGHGDLYSITALPTSLVPPSSISAVVTRACMAKSDAGARSGQVQLQSSATNVTSTPLSLSTSFQWNGRTDLVDPATTSAWTVNGVNAIQIGPSVAS